MTNQRFTHAIVRKPGRDFGLGLTTADFGEPSYDRMRQQHEAYVQTLESLGLEVAVLEPLPDYPDAHFVEDVAVVTPDVTIITNPGAPSRKGEAVSIEPVLAKHRNITRIEFPGTVDGGDVLMIGTRVFIGLSERTNREGAQQLGRILEQHGMTWTAVAVGEGLHLKSSVNRVGENAVVVTEAFAGHQMFRDYEQIILDDDEAYAANTLLINDCLLIPSGFPKTRERLGATGLRIMELDMSEAQKMDGGLTCLSLRF